MLLVLLKILFRAGSVSKESHGQLTIAQALIRYITTKKNDYLTVYKISQVQNLKVI